jgi:hypothetical protein
MVTSIIESIAESALAVIRSSSGTAAVYTAGERRWCFQIPDSLGFSNIEMSSRKDQFETQRTNFEAHDHGASHARALSGFPLRAGRSPWAQKLRTFAKIYFYLLKTYPSCKEISWSFFVAKIPIFSNLAKGKQQRMGFRYINYVPNLPNFWDLADLHSN